MKVSSVLKILTVGVLFVITVNVLGTSTSFAAKPRLNIGVEVFAIDDDVITKEKKEAEAADSITVSNTAATKEIMKTVKEGLSKKLKWTKGLFKSNSAPQTPPSNLAHHNAPKFKKKKVKIPSSTASKVLRDTESAFLAVRLKELLDDTQKYGTVYVIPASKEDGNEVSSMAFDYVIRTTILKSDGNIAGFKSEYRCSIDGFNEVKKLKVSKKKKIPELAYTGKNSPTITVLEGDPYDVVLEQIVKVFGKKVAKKQKKYSVKRHQELTLVRYGHDVAPEVYKDYHIIMGEGSRGYVVNPAPDSSNKQVARVTKMHRNELMAFYKFEKHYEKASDKVEVPYNLWRKETRRALIAYGKFKEERKKLKKEIQGKIIKELGLTKGSLLLRRLVKGEEITFENEAIETLAYFFKELVLSMVETDGHVTVIHPPDTIASARNHDMYEYVDLLEGYNEQLNTQAEMVESFEKAFSTITEPITLDLFTTICTYEGKVDVVFKRYKEDMRKMYYEETEGTGLPVAVRES